MDKGPADASGNAGQPLEHLEAPGQPETDTRAQTPASEEPDAQDSERHGDTRDVVEAEAPSPAPDAQGVEARDTEARDTKAAPVEAESADKHPPAKNRADVDADDEDLEDDSASAGKPRSAEETRPVAEDRPEASPPEEPVIPRSRAVAMHVRGDGHLADDPEETSDGGEPSPGTSAPDEKPETDGTETAVRHRNNDSAGPPPSTESEAVKASSEDPIDLLWPEEEDAATLPASAFQLIGQDEFPADAWPHPSTWAIPGTSWEELNEPKAEETSVETKD